MSGIDNSEVVVITGATSGIGRATARKFGEDGARVGLLARGEDGLTGAKEDIEDAGGEALTIQTDVADYEQVEDAADRIEALGYVLLMALLVYSLIERRARVALIDVDEPMDLAGRPTIFRPTGRRILERFENARLMLHTDGNRELPANDNVPERVLELLDLSVAVYGIEPEM